MHNVKIAIIGAGEVGRAYAAGAHRNEGFEVVLTDLRPPQAAVDLAAELNIPIHVAPGDWLQEIDRVWLVVSGDVALRAIDGLLPYLPTTAIIVDLTTATPADKRTAHARCSQAEVDYVDAVIMGPVGVTGAETALLATGAEADRAMADFVALGAPLTVLPDGSPGDAAAIKLLRTILTKGLESLAVEALVAAEEQGVRTELCNTFVDVDAIGFAGFLDVLVRSHVQHCERRLLEVDRAADQLRSLGLPARMLGASRQVFESSVAGRAQTPPPAEATSDVAVAIEWLTAVNRLPAAAVSS